MTDDGLLYLIELTDEVLREWSAWSKAALAFTGQQRFAALIAEVRRLRTENDALRQQVAGHAERIAAQSDLLSRRAEKPLTWTQEPPTVLGWYWWKGKTDPAVMQRTRRVYGDDDLHIYQGGGAYITVGALGGEWAGPLEPPA